MAAIRKHIFIGFGAAFLLIGVYLGILSLAQGFAHALKQTTDLWYWVLALAAGFGIQAGLFSFIRQTLRERRAAVTGAFATSGGVSTASMIACCAHHLSDLLPLLGLSGLALILVRSQVFFIVAGVMSNIVGITIMLETIQIHNLCPWVASIKWNLGLIRKGALATSAVVLAATFFVTVR